MKYLRDIIEKVNDDSFKPQAKGEKEFDALHTTNKIADRNGNGDDVFNATNVKTYSRKKMGEQPTKEDGNVKKLTALQKGVKVVATEEVEQVDEISKDRLTTYAVSARKEFYKNIGKGNSLRRQAAINRSPEKEELHKSADAADRKLKNREHGISLALDKKVDKNDTTHARSGKAKVVATEEVETIDERNKDNKEKKNIFISKKDRKGKTVVNTFDLRKAMTDHSHDKKRVNEMTVDEELNKKQCVKPVDKKINDRASGDLAIYLINKRYGKPTPKAKVKEEVEQVEEVSKELLTKYARKAVKSLDAASADKEHFTSTGQSHDAAGAARDETNRENGIKLADKKKNGANDVKVLAKEEVSTDTHKREIGTDSLVNNFKSVTPGEKTEKKKVSFNEALSAIAEITVTEVQIAEVKKIEEKAAIVEEAKTAPKKSMADLTSGLMRGGF